jgi:hypothetical protein
MAPDPLRMKGSGVVGFGIPAVTSSTPRRSATGMRARAARVP